MYNHHIAIKHVIPKTVAKNCLAPGNEEKETLGRSPFDIPDEILEELHEMGFPVRSVENIMTNSY